MDDGVLTDSQGKRVDFRNTLMVLTSNLGADALAALPAGSSSEQVSSRDLHACRRHVTSRAPRPSRRDRR